MNPEDYNGDTNYVFSFDEFMNRPIGTMRVQGEWGEIVRIGPPPPTFRGQLILFPCKLLAHVKHRYHVMEWSQTHYPSGLIINVAQRVCMRCDDVLPSMHAVSEQMALERAKVDRLLDLEHRKQMAPTHSHNIQYNGKNWYWQWPYTSATGWGKFTNITSS